jgi:cell division protein FtsZ
MDSLNVRVPAALLDTVDETYPERGFSSRSEFVREVLRDAVEAEPTLDPQALDHSTEDSGESLSLEEAKRELRSEQLRTEAAQTFEGTDSEMLSFVAQGDPPTTVDTVIESDIGNRVSEERDEELDILVAGCGGGGVRIVSELYRRGSESYRTAIIDTDLDQLNDGVADTRAVLGKHEFDGGGADGDVDAVRDAVRSSRPVIERMIGDPDLVFVVAGLGGGTGTAVAPEVARMSRDLDAVTVSLATLPFGTKKPVVERAREGLSALDEESHTLAVLDANRIAADPGVSMSQTLRQMNDNIAHVILQICLDVGQFYTIDRAGSLLSRLREGGRSVLLDSKIDISEDETYDELSDRLLRYTNIDITAQRAGHAILTFTADSDIDNPTDHIDRIVASIRNHTEELTWSSRKVSTAQSPAQSGSQLAKRKTIRVAGLFTGLNVELDRYFDREETGISDPVDTTEESDIEILPGTGGSATTEAGQATVP